MGGGIPVFLEGLENNVFRCELKNWKIYKSENRSMDSLNRKSLKVNIGCGTTLCILLS